MRMQEIDQLLSLSIAQGAISTDSGENYTFKGGVHSYYIVYF